jgi:N-methylhydantoinase B
MSVEKQDLITHIQAGAGGYGDPHHRDPLLVLEDVLDEKITPQFAREQHGVCFYDDGQVDVEATKRARGGQPLAAG